VSSPTKKRFSVTVTDNQRKVVIFGVNVFLTKEKTVTGVWCLQIDGECSVERCRKLYRNFPRDCHAVDLLFSRI